MKPIWIFMIVIACPVTTLGQGNGSGSPNQGSPPSQPVSPPYQPAVSPASTPAYGAGWGYGAGQTPAGAALQGLSQVISSAGQYNLDSSAAAVNLSQAESNEMRNASEAVLGFWAMRDFGRMEREKERGPRPTPEELARRADDGAPRVLSPKQIDPVSGELTWPLVLKDASFEVAAHCAGQVHGQVDAIRWPGQCRSGAGLREYRHHARNPEVADHLDPTPGLPGGPHVSGEPAVRHHSPPAVTARSGNRWTAVSGRLGIDGLD